MIQWPDPEELKQVLDVDPESDAWDGEEDSGLNPTRLSRLLAAAMAYVKGEVGDWDEVMDEPDERLAQAALRMAELMALKPEVAAAVAGAEATAAVAGDPVYRAYMTGKHRRFGFSFMATLKGGKELQARLRAISQTFKPIGREWADTTARVAKPMVPVRTGTLRASIKRRNATLKRATVYAHYTAFFVDAGTVRHAMVPKRGKRLVFTEGGGRTIFARRVDHPQTHAQPFRQRAAEEGLRRTPMAQKMIDLWNGAA